MFKNILIICVGNICRSPTAEVLFRQALPSDYSVSSAGIGALVGQTIEPNAAEVLQSAGFDPSAHTARQATPEMIRAADLVLAMEKRHIAHLLKIAPEARGKTYLLGKWEGDREVPDPYRKGPEYFKNAFEYIQISVSSWTKKILQNHGTRQTKTTKHVL